MHILNTLIALFFVASLSAQNINIQDTIQTYDDVKNQTVNIEGNSELHLNAEDPIDGATFNIYGDNVWVFIHNERPSYLKERLSQFTVNGSVAVDDENVRVHQYEMGTVLISQNNDYVGATLFDGENLSGDSLNLVHHIIFNGEDDLGTMNNVVSSFILRKGYMMTIAQQSNGSGYSRNYVADKEDITVNALPEGLNNEVSFVRVVRWNWPSKKGINNMDKHGYAVEATWSYSWGSGSESRDNFEFVPMKWRSSAGGSLGDYWFDTKNITHQLAFNEPSHEEQANMSVDGALREYAKLLATGLRAGSPNIADNGRDWLYEFMEKADELNYRVDFVGVHWYKGCSNATNFYNWIKQVHERTGRPIWVTEFNNGASWTGCTPTYEEQAAKIATFLHMFDTCSFVERYCIYPWVGPDDYRHIMPNNGADSTLYPAGEVYLNQQSPFAYTGAVGHVPPYVEIPKPMTLTISKDDNNNATLTWYENAYQEDGFSIERSLNDGAFTEIGRVEGEQSYKVTFTDNTLSDFGTYTYRIRAFKGDEYSTYSEEVSTILDDGNYAIVYIQHNESGQRLIVNNGTLEMGSANETGSKAEWIIIPADDAYSFVEHIASESRLHNGEEVPDLTENKWTGDNVQWALGDAGNDYYYLTNKSRGERIFTKSDNLTLQFVPTNYTGTKVQWKFVNSGASTALSEMPKNLYHIKPNPAQTLISIEGLEQMTKVKVLDVSGRLVMQTMTHKNMDVANLRAGIYFLQIGENDLMRFIKE